MHERKTAWLIVAGVALFLAGFVPAYLKGRNLDRKVARATQREQVYRVRDLLGTAFLQISLKNYGIAQEDASRFFTEARQVASATDSPELRSALDPLLARRDEINAKMGRAAPELYSDLQQMYRTLVDQTQPVLARTSEAAP